MKWNQTVASTCRYGSEAGAIFGDADIIWENSDCDYQGHARVHAFKDNVFIEYEWSYGSCSGCDEWEARGFDSEKIVAEMRHGLAVFTLEQFRGYVDKLETECGNPYYRDRSQPKGMTPAEALKTWLQARERGGAPA